MKFLQLNSTDAINLEDVSLVQVIPEPPNYSMSFTLSCGISIRATFDDKQLSHLNQLLFETQRHHGKDQRTQHRHH